LKTLEQATEIRRRVLTAFELAERSDDERERQFYLTFVIVGGGPTGVELAGALAEMCRFTIRKDFRRIDPSSAKIMLLEAGPRILAAFDATQAARALRDLERMGVTVLVQNAVTKVDSTGIDIGDKHVPAATVLWAAGVQASNVGERSGFQVDRNHRVLVEPDLSVPGHPNIFVAGDMASLRDSDGKPLPAMAPVAMQQGRYVASAIASRIDGKPAKPFHFVDKGQMATIGRSRAIVEFGKLHLSGFIAWVFWLIVHIYYLTGFPNRLLVVMQWAWYYLSYHRGARLILGKRWQMHDDCEPNATTHSGTPER
jgi:NADH dehydrogenase